MILFFDCIFQPYIIQNKYKHFCEIGASKGANTDRLLQLDPKRHVIIDPCVDSDLEDKYKNSDNVLIYKGFSLQILPQISEVFDCIFIDGDHNWYTVYNELELIDKKIF